MIAGASRRRRPIITADDGTTVVGRSPEAVQSVLP
jgi:arsenate reductase